MSKEDYYETLGINKSSTDDEIKKAYRKKAMKYHPDRNAGDAKAEKEFKKINEAYYILKDKEKKSQYDQFGHQAFENGGAGFKDFNFSGGGFSDIFEEMFGDFDEDVGGIFGGGRRRGNRTNSKEYGSDLRYDMEVSLEEIFSGKKLLFMFQPKLNVKIVVVKDMNLVQSQKNVHLVRGMVQYALLKGFLQFNKHALIVEELDK